MCSWQVKEGQWKCVCMWLEVVSSTVCTFCCSEPIFISKFRSIVCSGLRDLDLHIQFVVCNMLTCREVRQPLFIKDQLSFRKPQLLAAGTTCSSGRPLLCSLHFHYREQTFLHVDSNKRTGDCFFVIYLTFVYFVIFLMMSFKQKQTGTQTCE